MTKQKRYDNDSISSLKGADRVRLRPGVIFGSDDLQGCAHAFFEILSNSIDEAREGYGKTITITRFEDYSLQVEDEARGIPLDYNVKEERYNWELVYCELYAGGKYNNNDGTHYEYSLGLNGLGACATQYASAWFKSEVVRDGFRYRVEFERGQNIGGLSKEEIKTRRTGTKQHWLPDTEVFTDIKIPLDYFQTVLKQQAIVNAGVKFVLVDKIGGMTEEFMYPDGIAGYVGELSGDEPLTKLHTFAGQGEGKDREDKAQYKVKCSVAFAFCPSGNEIYYFHNSSWLEHGGSPDRAVRTSFVSAFDREIKAQNKYKAGESKITFNDIQDSLILVTNSFSTLTSYENQTKKSINNKYIQEFISGLCKEQLEIWFLENRVEAARALEQVLINKRSRESAEKQRLNIKKKLMGAVDFNNRVKNFVDCRSRDVNKREVYIVEGNSALGSVKMARDSEYQAVIPLRGKILNCLKADLNTIFKNDIIVDMLKVLGCGVEITGKHAKKDMATFQLDKLRWHKIIICTDADVDGFQIRTLILAALYRLVPTLIRKGYVYIANSPLYEITHTVKRLEKTYFAYSETEKTTILKRLEGAGKVHLQRSKGLGENEPDMMWHTTMNPETRQLIAVTPVAEAEMEQMFALLLGNDLQSRKKFIEEHGQEYLDMLDVG